MGFPILVRWHLYIEPAPCSAPSHYINQCWIIIIKWTIGNKFQWSFNENATIFIHENEFENAVNQMFASCLGLNVLMQNRQNSSVNTMELSFFCTKSFNTTCLVIKTPMPILNIFSMEDIPMYHNVKPSTCLDECVLGRAHEVSMFSSTFLGQSSEQQAFM